MTQTEQELACKGPPCDCARHPGLPRILKGAQE